MPWKVNIDNKEVDSVECPHIWRSPIEQLCTAPEAYKLYGGAFKCHAKKDCPLVKDDMTNVLLKSTPIPMPKVSKFFTNMLNKNK